MPAADPFCTQRRRAIARSKARGRVALVILDTLGIHTPRRSKLLRTLLLEEEGEHLVLVYTPSYDSDSHRIEWLWAAFRDAVTHNHQRATFEMLLQDATAWLRLSLRPSSCGTSAARPPRCRPP